MMIDQVLSYFGSKYSSAERYPAPRGTTIVEPFAGSAGYSCHYADRRVILGESSPVMAQLWKWLIGAEVSEILELPVPSGEEIKGGQWVVPNNLRPEASWLIGLWVNPNSSMPKKKMSRFTSGVWSAGKRAEIAGVVAGGWVKHWQVHMVEWQAWMDVGFLKKVGVKAAEVTWFVDPPYQKMANYYAGKLPQAGFRQLGGWCRSVEGQVIVCEQARDADNVPDWLPFRELGLVQTRDGTSRELIWDK